jgi:hypothetical protein
MRPGLLPPTLIIMLLTSVATAHAESWVLWENLAEERNERRIRDIWQVIDAFEKRNDCLAARNAEFTRQEREKPLSPDDSKYVVRGDGMSGGVLEKRGESHFLYRYWCLPGTVDPRGPKGK